MISLDAERIIGMVKSIATDKTISTAALTGVSGRLSVIVLSVPSWKSM